MNWDAIGAIAEAAAAVATLAMLVYLAIQIRQNTNALKSTTFLTANSEIARALMSSPADAELATKPLDELTPAERIARIDQIASFFAIYESMFYLQKRGSIEEDLWRSRENHIRLWLSMQIGELFWADRKRWYSSEFAAHVESLRASDDA